MLTLGSFVSKWTACLPMCTQLVKRPSHWASDHISTRPSPFFWKVAELLPECVCTPISRGFPPIMQFNLVATVMRKSFLCVLQRKWCVRRYEDRVSGVSTKYQWYQYRVSVVSVQRVNGISTVSVVSVQSVSGISTECQWCQHRVSVVSVQSVSDISTECQWCQYRVSVVSVQSVSGISTECQYRGSMVSVQSVSGVSTECQWYQYRVSVVSVESVSGVSTEGQ